MHSAPATAALLLVAAALVGCDAGVAPATIPAHSAGAGASALPRDSRGGTGPSQLPTTTAVPLVSGSPPSSTPTAATTFAPTFQPDGDLGDAPVGRTEPAVVVRVVDGDTIVVDRGLGDERVRYIGVDTPETVAPGSPVEWMGPEASAANKALVEGKDVVLELDVSETDRFGRLLRYVWIRDESRPSGWLFVNLELLARGFAQVVTYPPDVRYVDLYLAAQAEAREAGRGLWGAEGPTVTAPPEVPGTPAGGACHPSYRGACLAIGKGDYDCAGGQGNGPNYLATTVRVVGPDYFRLDGDGDGLGCE